MKKICIVTSKKWYGVCKEDNVLIKASKNRDIDLYLECWETENVDWQQFDLIIIRSVWNYYEDIDEFLKWLNYLDALCVNVANGLNRILCNINKIQQMTELQRLGIPIIPFKPVYKVEDYIKAVNSYSEDKFVIKPCYSASGYRTHLLNKIDSNYLTSFHQIISEDFSQEKHGAIIQKYIEEINNGEISLIYFKGNFSHSVIRYPGVIAAKKPVEIYHNISTQLLRFANDVIKKINYSDALYVRVDVVKVNESYLVMEIECMDPDLYLRYFGDKVDLFLDEINKELI